MTLKGEKAPEFDLPGNGDSTVSFPSGKPSVLYFYPKDDTPGCTTQGKTFSELKPQFDALGVDIVGVSPDTVAKHDKFVAKHDLTIALASDPDHIALTSYNVWVEKSMYGRKYMGVERSTFLVDADGTIVEEWRKVRVKGHVEAVLDAAKTHFGD